ncbi:MAG TPA: carboxyltransferase domain-containing protein [Actinomycetota bacterium]|nr:carboxyltransferase domain-containing protein [Actinomycetota bacterium]
MWRWQGESAIVVRFDGPLIRANERARAAAAAAATREDVLAAVPGARTVLAHLHDGADPAAVDAALRAAPPVAAGEIREHRIEVVYDGEDLVALGAERGLAPREIVALHTGATYTVAFLGFMPGFAYLLGLPEPLYAARLATPRTRVPAGAVAIAGVWAGVYPSASPGGWRLLGRTDASLFDASAVPPAMLAPGDVVRFAEA